MQGCIDYINSIYEMNKKKIKSGVPETALLKEQNLFFRKTVELLKGFQPGGKARERLFEQMKREELTEDIISKLEQMDEESTHGYSIDKLVKSNSFFNHVISRFYEKDATRCYWDNIQESIDEVLAEMCRKQ